MTIDKEKLKALAQAVADLEDQPELEAEHAEANDALWLHMHCHTIMALLADIERLESEAMHTAAGVQSDREQREQLKAENEALRKDAERYRGERRIAIRRGLTSEQYDQKTDSRIACFDEFMAKEKIQ